MKKQGDIWVWQGGFDTRHLPKGAGFRWDPERKVWWTKILDVAAKLAVHAQGTDKDELDAYLAKKTESLAGSRAADADIEVPAPDGLSYLPFQKAGIKYALQRVNTLIGDEPGLGKTIQTIGIMNATKPQSVLVVCPASLKLNWAREIRKWATYDVSVGIADGGNWPTTNVVIVNYDILVKHEARVKGPWDLLVVDECHRIKNPKTIRTQQILGAQDKDGTWKVEPIKATRRLFLTGTPLVNRPIELWGIVHALAPETFTSFWGFAKRYCNATEGRYGWDMTGSSHLDELQEKLRASVMVRRLKDQVLTELPPKRRQVIEVATNGAKGVVDAERESYATHQERLVELKAQVEVAKAGTDDEYNDAVKALREGAQLAFTEMSTHRHDVALAKVPAVVEHIKDTIEGGKVVVFAHHHDVIDAIASEFPGCAVFTGRDSIEAKQAAVDRFQSDEACMVFVGSIQAAGVGITLTAASHVVFAELDWVPGNMSQAEDRCHRIGQHDSVLVQHLVLDGSIDSIMAKTLVAKQEVIDKALDVQQPFAEPVIPVDAPATEGISRKHLETPQIKPERVAAIHTALRMLAGVCDGAQNLDGVGFNKIDTAVGKSLAEQLTLTPRQALLGAAIVRKYRRQVTEEVYQVCMGGKEQ